MSVVQQVLPISEFHQILKRRIRTNVPELCYEPCRNALRVNSRTKLAARLHDNSARILTRSELLLFHISLTLKVLTNQSIILNSYSLRLVPRRADPILAGSLDEVCPNFFLRITMK